MSRDAKRKAAEKWLSAEMKKKMLPRMGEDMTEDEIKVLVVETMRSAMPWMQELLGNRFKPQNALEFFKMVLDGDDDE